jgi:predicted RNase H-like HicB family nuclease
MKKAGLKADWRQGENKVKLQVPVMLFTEKKVHVAYIPVLDLSGYGNSEKEAIGSLQIVLDNYLDYTIKKNTLIQDLKNHNFSNPY